MVEQWTWGSWTPWVVFPSQYALQPFAGFTIVLLRNWEQINADGFILLSPAICQPFQPFSSVGRKSHRSTMMTFLHAETLPTGIPKPILLFDTSSSLSSCSCRRFAHSTLHIPHNSNFSHEPLQQISKRNWRRRKNPRMQLERGLRRRQRPQVIFYSCFFCIYVCVCICICIF